MFFQFLPFHFMKGHSIFTSFVFVHGQPLPQKNYMACSTTGWFHLVVCGVTTESLHRSARLGPYIPSLLILLFSLCFSLSNRGKAELGFGGFLFTCSESYPSIYWAPPLKLFPAFLTKDLSEHFHLWQFSDLVLEIANSHHFLHAYV